MSVRKQILLLLIPIIAYFILILSTTGWKTKKINQSKPIVIQIPFKSFNKSNLSFSEGLIANNALDHILLPLFAPRVNCYKKSTPIICNAFLDFQIIDEDIISKEIHSVYIADSIIVKHCGVLDWLLMLHKFSGIPVLPKAQK